MQYFPIKNKRKRLQNFHPLLNARRAALGEECSPRYDLWIGVYAVILFDEQVSACDVVEANGVGAGTVGDVGATLRPNAIGIAASAPVHILGLVVTSASLSKVTLATQSWFSTMVLMAVMALPLTFQPW